MSKKKIVKKIRRRVKKAVQAVLRSRKQTGRKKPVVDLKRARGMLLQYASKVKWDDVPVLADKALRKAGGLLSSGFEHGANLAKQVKLLCRLLRDWVKGSYPLPWKSVSVIAGALVYFLSPIDLIPDFVPVVGYLDDATVVGIAAGMIQEDLRDYARKKRLRLADFGLA